VPQGTSHSLAFWNSLSQCRVPAKEDVSSELPYL